MGRSAPVGACVVLGLLGLLGGCAGHVAPAGGSRASPSPGDRPRMAVTIRADRTLVVRPVGRSACVAPVRGVLQLDDATLEVFLAGDPVPDCGAGRRSPVGPGRPVRFALPPTMPLTSPNRSRPTEKICQVI